MDYGREPRDGLRGAQLWLTRGTASQQYVALVRCGQGARVFCVGFFPRVATEVFPRVATEVRSSRCHGGVAPTLRRAGDEILKNNKFKGVRGEG